MMNTVRLFVGIGVMMFSSCPERQKGPTYTFDYFEKGAYVKLVKESAREINLLDIDGSSYIFSVEFIDAEQGNKISEYRLDVTFRDMNHDNGDLSGGPGNLRSFTQADMSTNQNGLRSISDISIAAHELISLMGLSADDVLPGDAFRLNATVITDDGQLFSFVNSTAAINGSGFRGHFRQTLTTFCPSNLSGTYDYTVLSVWCDTIDTAEGEITWTQTPSGYAMDDFSLGAYKVCYGTIIEIPLPGSLRMVDVCNKIKITGTSIAAQSFTWHSLNVAGKDLIIEWSNTYGEGGTTAIHNPAGWPPLELK